MKINVFYKTDDGADDDNDKKWRRINRQGRAGQGRVSI